MRSVECDVLRIASTGDGGADVDGMELRARVDGDDVDEVTERVFQPVHQPGGGGGEADASSRAAKGDIAKESVGPDVLGVGI